MECIEKVEEVDDYERNEGFIVHTNVRKIFIFIDNSSQCCEQWGHLSLNKEDLAYYVGAELLGLSVVEPETYEQQEILELVSQYGDDFSAAFVDIRTSKGTLQLAVYNVHNGYYGHRVLVKDSTGEIFANTGV